MRIAIPIVNNEISEHFGHCEKFYLYDLDTDAKTYVNREILSAPPHKPGLLPRWLRERGADAIITKGIGSRAIALFEQNGINVVYGTLTNDPEKALADYIAGNLETDANICDH